MDRWAVQIDANQIVYVEAYGMATVVGDLREIMALTEVRT